MLPSSGVFREIDCPFNNAICGRPYCHFRHKSKKKMILNIETVEDSADNSNSSNEVPTYKPTPKSQLASTRGHLPISYVPDLVIRSERSSNRPLITMPTIEYKPTPKSILSSTKSVAEYFLSPLGKSRTAEIATISNVVDNIDLEDLDTEFGLIDEILSDGSFVEDKASKEDTKVVESKDENAPKKTSSTNSKRKSSKSIKKDKEQPSKHKNSSNSSSKRKERDKEKDKSLPIKGSSKDKGRDKETVNKTEKSIKDKPKSTKSASTSSNIKYKSISNSSSNSGKSKITVNNDKDSKSSKDKSKEKHHKSTKSSHRKSTSESKSKSKNSTTNSKNTLEDNVQNLPNSNDSNKHDLIHDYSNYDPDDLNIEEEEEDDDDPTLEEECYRIFNEYKPIPITELEKASPPDEKYVPEDIATIGKKRIAYENAEKMTIKKLPPLSERMKVNIPSPAQAMLNRIKQVRLAQSSNEQNNIVMELKRQQEELRMKKSSFEKVNTNVVPKVNADSLQIELKRQQDELRLKRRRDQAEDEMKPITKVVMKNSIIDSSQRQNILKSSQTATSNANYPSNGRDLIVANKIKNRVAHQASTTDNTTTTNLIDDILNGRASKQRKIAPVPNVTSIQKAKERVDHLKTIAAQTQRTTAHSGPKAQSRVAHIPDYSLAELPDVTHTLRSKLPVNVRTRYLTMFADEAVKLYLSREDAYSRAVGEEDKCYERCSTLATYRNCAMLAINRLRKEVKERETNGLGPMDGVEDEGVETEQGLLGGERLYEMLAKYKMSEEELELHGFPMASAELGRAQIKIKSSTTLPLPDNQRICARCKKVYLIDKRGFPQYEEECIYHPLKKRTFRGDRTYLCCKSPDDTGCITSNTHVSEISELRMLTGYQTTLSPSTSSDPRSHSIYALDCEMCYTTIGLELTRVTIVDPQMKTVYESFVKPLNSILDYNTQFSGITRDQMERTSTNILQVQANILHLCNSNTILIGHSLESDLKALKIIHGSVIDTSVMFPHKFGLPHKRALRALASDYLQKIIQNSVSGHDSAEDALTCMELIMWRVKEELKVKGINCSAGSSKKR